MNLDRVISLACAAFCLSMAILGKDFSLVGGPHSRPGGRPLSKRVGRALCIVGFVFFLVAAFKVGEH
jgi:hypothetical protein